MTIGIEVRGSAQKWPLPTGTDKALWWDFALILGYGAALLLTTTVATKVFWSERARTVARLGRGAAVVTIIADVLENFFLALAVHGEPGKAMSGWQATFLNTAAAASTIKWSCLVPAVMVALVGLLIALVRLAASSKRPPEPGSDAPQFPLGPKTLVLPQPLEESPPHPRIVVPAGSQGAVGTDKGAGHDGGATSHAAGAHPAGAKAARAAGANAGLRSKTLPPPSRCGRPGGPTPSTCRESTPKNSGRESPRTRSPLSAFPVAASGLEASPWASCRQCGRSC
jgi:hypothetical protein